MNWKRYRKRPVVIEAIRWFCLGDLPSIVKPYNKQGVCEVCGGKLEYHGWIETLEGGHVVCPGDWIVKGVEGEFYPVKPAIFDKTYEEVGEH